MWSGTLTVFALLAACGQTGPAAPVRPPSQSASAAVGAELSPALAPLVWWLGDWDGPSDRTRLRCDDPTDHRTVSDGRPELAMTTTQDIAAELMHRINADAKHLEGALPERTAIAWRGYLAAALEWNVITVEQYDSLLAQIPPVDDDPAIAILRGRG
jgi:hypothetical protein